MIKRALLIILLFTSFAYAGEQITSYDESTLPILNETIRKLSDAIRRANTLESGGGDSNRIAQGTFDLTAQYNVDPNLWLVDLHVNRFPRGIYITKIYVDCTVADPATELSANLNYCDAVAGGAFPGASVTLIKAIGTTTGNFADTAVNITVPAGRSIYIAMTADPVDTATQYHIRIHYYLPAG